jgi:NADH:ubiquinone reductase (non-electrogenic)
MCSLRMHRVTVIEAKELLGTFDGSLREYAARKLVAQGVKLRRVSHSPTADAALLPAGIRCVFQ